MTSTSQLKRVDDKSHRIVFGWIHDIERIILSDDGMIPEAIINVILIFYFQFIEQFRDKSSGPGINVSLNNSIAEKTKDLEWESVFGTIIIDCSLYIDTICTWTLKMHSNDVYKEYFSIGLVSINNDEMEQDGDQYCFGGEQSFYAWSTNTQNSMKLLESNNMNTMFENPDISNMCLLQNKSHNILKMELNIANRTVKYFGNKLEFFKSFKNIDVTKKYQFALCLYNQGTKVEITDFTIIDISDK